MKMVPVEKNKIESVIRPKGYLVTMLEKFLDGNYDCVKIEDYPHKKASYCCSSISECIKNNKMVGVKVIRRGTDVFLVKTEI